MGRTRRGCGRCQCHRHQPPCLSVSDVKRSDWLVHKFHCLGQHFVACVLASTNTTPQRSITPSDCDVRWHPLPHTLRDALSQVSGLPLATSPVVCARLPVNIFVRSTKHRPAVCIPITMTLVNCLLQSHQERQAVPITTPGSIT
jgi:hypothetical protein